MKTLMHIIYALSTFYEKIKTFFSSLFFYQVVHKKQSYPWALRVSLTLYDLIYVEKISMEVKLVATGGWKEKYFSDDSFSSQYAWVSDNVGGGQ